MRQKAQTRRDMLIQTGLSTSLMACGQAANAFTGTSGEALNDVLRRVDINTSNLRSEQLSIAHWRTALDEIYSQIDLADLLGDMDFERLAQETGYAGHGVATQPLHLSAPDGGRLSFVPKLFAVGQGRAIIPHGHDNMVSAHLTLSGQFHLRQYDKVSVEDNSLLITPSVDTHIRPGDVSSISEHEDNIHWFIAEENAHTFDVIVLGLNENSGHDFDIYNLDMNMSERVGNDVFRVPRLSVSDALRLYG